METPLRNPPSNVQRPASIRAILWDLDGVIVNSGDFHYESYRRLLGHHGVELTRERFFGTMFGRRNWDILSEVFPEAPREEIERLAQGKEEIFRRLLVGKIKALPGAKELLRRAHEAGLRQAIVSSTPRANLDLITETLGIRGLLDETCGEEDTERGKPDPQPFTSAADHLGVAYGDCVVLEDAPEGIQAAKAANMLAIGVTTTRPAERLSQADLIVASLEDPAVYEFIFGRAPLSS